MDVKQTAPVGGAQERTEIDLIDMISYYLARLPIIIVAFVVGAVAAGMYTHYMITPMYKATTKLYMVSATSGSVVDLSDLSLSSTLSGDYKELLKIRPIYEDIVEELDLNYSYSQLRGMVSVENISDTRVLQITATNSDPELARDIANAVAQKAIEYLPEVMETSNKPHVAESAILPTSPSSPNLTGNAMRGAMVGLLLALAVLTLMYLADDTLKTAEDVEKTFGIIPLTVIPESPALAALSKSGNENTKKKKKKREKKGGKK